MNGTAVLLLVMFVAVAAFDWAAVHSGNEGVRVVTKPGCMLVLIAAAVALDPVDEAAGVALLVALALSLLGDVFLLGGEKPKLFVAGLVAFLLAHLAYVVAFALDGVSPGGLVAGVLVGAVLVGTVGARVVAAAQAGDEPTLAGPVRAYVVVIAAMLATAVATADPLAILGAGLFAASDSLIARDRFVRSDSAGGVPRGGPRRRTTAKARSELTIIVTYHVAQLLLVISFA